MFEKGDRLEIERLIEETRQMLENTRAFLEHIRESEEASSRYVQELKAKLENDLRRLERSRREREEPEPQRGME